MSKIYKRLSVSLPLGITWTDYPSIGDCAVIVYFTGCKHDCPGCQNPELQGHSMGTWFDYIELANMIIDEAEKAHTNKVVFSGGDVYFQALDTIDVMRLIIALNQAGLEICVYTGTNIEKAMKYIPYATYYKCGKYDEHNREKEWGKFPDKMVFVSKNQKLYDKDGKQISVDNAYYFNKWDTLKAKIKKFLKRG